MNVNTTGMVAWCVAAAGAATVSAQSFVEPDVEVVHTYVAEARNDNFGWVTARIGDQDADGRADLIITAPLNDAGGFNAGRVYIFSTNPDADPAQPIRVLTATRNNAQFGNNVGDAGRIDADDVCDVIVGAPGGRGDAFVYSGADGRQIHAWRGENPGDALGAAVCPAGDLTGDGVSELLVGATGFDTPAGANAGRVYIFDGATGAVFDTIDGTQGSGNLGSIVAPFGDLDDDGVADFGAGAPGEGPGGRGAVYVYSGADRSVLCRIANPSAQGVSLASLFLSTPGDVDADGRPDVYFTDFSSDGGRGRAYVYAYDPGDGACRPLRTFTGAAPGDQLGIGNGRAGDLDGDGYADLIVGVYLSSVGASRAGQVDIYSGWDGSLLRRVTSTVANETLGFDAHGMGDVTGDGVPDMALSAAWNPFLGGQDGKVYLVKGAAACVPDVNRDGVLNFFDVSAYLALLLGGDPAADLDRDGVLGFADLSDFVDAFGAGC